MTNDEIESTNASSAAVLTVSIGDIRIALISHEPDFRLEVQRATKRFLVDNDDDADVIVRAGWGEVHACGVEDSDGRAYHFVGQSGAGKPTTARLWHKARGIHVLSDDRIIL